MRILFLAPQPFFQERGTPIAVRLAVEVIAGRDSGEVDLLTYHEGHDIEIPNAKLHRIKVPFVKNVGPGISFKKLFCDLIYFWTVLRMIFAAKKEDKPYQLIHAVEESVFIAWLAKHIFGIPYIYDMDSSLAMQLTEKWWLLAPLTPLFEWLEKLAVKGSVAVVPVCDALAVIADQHGSKDTHILRDISLLDVNEPEFTNEDLRAAIGGDEESLLAIYIGNLEKYQGIDLLVDSFAKCAAELPNCHVVVIGGRDEHIKEYNDKISQLGIASQTHFVGPRPVRCLAEFLSQADILLSPRTKGNNTPMKIYSYLHAGKPVLATRLPTHTQVLDDDNSCLANPDLDDFSKKLAELFSSKELREKFGSAGFKCAEELYTFEVFTRRLNELYDRVGKRIDNHRVLKGSVVQNVRNS